MSQKSQNTICREVIDKYLNGIDMSNGKPSPREVEDDLLDLLGFEIAKENTCRSAGHRLPIPRSLPHMMIVELMLSFYFVRRLIYHTKETGCDLVLYQETGPDAGLYTSDKSVISNTIRQFNVNIKGKEIDDIIRNLFDRAESCYLTEDPNLIAVNNGIFNYETKELLPFSPDYVFITKSNVNYNPDAKNVMIHNDLDGTDWDVESWVNDLSDNPDVVTLLWQVIGAVIRPHVRWNKVVCFYSEQGNNGKGTLCQLLRNICGDNRCAAIPFDKFGHEFMLEQLVHATAIVVDENTTKTFNKETGVLKSIITNDYFSINRKYKSPITMKFCGLMVQCINDLPKFVDKSESLYRRFLFVPFDKCFTGRERTYIKSDYLARTDVLEYVLFKVLNTNYNSFIEPDVTKQILTDYKSYNDPVRDFLFDILPQLKWSLVPYSFLYDLYKSWFSDNCPSGQPLSSKTFTHDIKEILRSDDNWDASDSPVITRHRMDDYEPLIAQYKLTKWMNSNYKGSDSKKICDFERKSSYRGILKRSLNVQ